MKRISFLSLLMFGFEVFQCTLLFMCYLFSLVREKTFTQLFQIFYVHVASLQPMLYLDVCTFLYSFFFLSLFSHLTIIGIGVCANYRFFPGLTREKILFHSWISGLALLIEPTKRRGNLTLYVVAFLADCLFNTWQEKTQIGKATKLPSKLMLLIATSLIFNQNQNSGFMKWLFTI